MRPNLTIGFYISLNRGESEYDITADDRNEYIYDSSTIKLRQMKALCYGTYSTNILEVANFTLRVPPVSGSQESPSRSNLIHQAHS